MYPSYHLLSLALIKLIVISSSQQVNYHCGDDDWEGYDCHPSNPTYFVRCEGGRRFEFQCPRGLHFSTKTQICDWPHKADCSHSTSQEDDHDYNVQPLPVYGESLTDEQPPAMYYDEPSHIGTEDTGEYFEVNEQGTDYGPKKWEPIQAEWDRGTTNRPWWRPARLRKPWWSMNTGSSEGNKKDVHAKQNRLPARQVSQHKPASGETCDHSCQLPFCYCITDRIPGGLSLHDTPQMVMLTFDDDISAEYYGYWQRLFRPGRYNPNGCPVRGTLFVSGSGTDYDLVYPLYAMGNEIAVHSISHRFPADWWATASYDEYVQEISGMRTNLVERSGIPIHDMKGFRVPFLQIGGDNMFKTLYDNKFVYDSSLFTGGVWGEAENPIWPFTLDYVPDEDNCQLGPCPQESYPGLWEIPVQRWYGLDGHSCAMPDGCTATGSAEEALAFFRKNFIRYYDGNRAPLGIFVHARWFRTEHHLHALDMFIDELLMMPDVWFVTPSQVVNWMQKPTAVHDIQAFDAWACDESIKTATFRAKMYQNK